MCPRFQSVHQPTNGAFLLFGEGVFGMEVWFSPAYDGFHLDCNSSSGTNRDEVDLSASYSDVAISDSQTMALEEDGGDRLTEAPYVAPG